MSLFTDYTAAPQIDEELESVSTVYGESILYAGGSMFRAKTVTTAYRYRIVFLTKTEAAHGAGHIQAAFDAEAATTGRAAGTAKAVRAHRCDGYDIVVSYCDSVPGVEDVTPA